jgi:hypothetical protein
VPLLLGLVPFVPEVPVDWPGSEPAPAGLDDPDPLTPGNWVPDWGGVGDELTLPDVFEVGDNPGDCGWADAASCEAVLELLTAPAWPPFVPGAVAGFTAAASGGWAAEAALLAIHGGAIKAIGIVEPSRLPPGA